MYACDPKARLRSLLYVIVRICSANSRMLPTAVHLGMDSPQLKVQNQQEMLIIIPKQ